jgi:hypothetical protein
MLCGLHLRHWQLNRWIIQFVGNLETEHFGHLNGVMGRILSGVENVEILMNDLHVLGGWLLFMDLDLVEHCLAAI